MNNYLLTAIRAAIQAGDEILKIYESDIVVEWKEDRSPLTEADKRSHDRITAQLTRTGFPVLSEEGKQISFDERKNWNTFWMIDPLDGTKEFIKRNGEFTVNIALIDQQLPVIGAVYLPVKRCLYFGSEHTGSYKREFQEGERIPEELEALLSHSEKLGENGFPEKYTIVASRSHLSPETEQFINDKKQVHGGVALISAGSSLKLCMVAERKANVYPRLAPTMEWDTAAGHAVAKFAGCKVFDFKKGTELRYNKTDLHNPWFIVAH